MKVDIKEIKQLKLQLIPDTKNFLISIAQSLLNSKIKNKTLNPTLITHKEFIDTSLSKLIKAIKEKIVILANQNGLNTDDKIVEVKIEYLSAYILKYDMANEKYIHKTIAEYIVSIIKKDYLKLNYFVSTLNRDVYSGKYAKYRYPVLYPFDKQKYNNPIPLLKQILNRVESVKKSLYEKELQLKMIIDKLSYFEFEIKQIKTAASDMKDIVVSLKSKYKEKELYDRLMMIKNQHSRFNVLLSELKDKIIKYNTQKSSISKNIDGFKQKYQDILSKEDEIIEELATNLTKMKTKI